MSGQGSEGYKNASSRRPHHSLESDPIQHPSKPLLLLIGPVTSNLKNDSIESFLEMEGLSVKIQRRVTRKKKKFAIAEVCVSRSSQTVTEFFNSYFKIEDCTVRVRRLKKERFGERDDPEYNIYVGNLPREITRGDLGELFGGYGYITRIHIKKKSRKSNFAFSFITFRSKEVAESLRRAGKIEYNGRTLFIRDTQKSIGGGYESPQNSSNNRDPSEQVDTRRSGQKDKNISKNRPNKTKKNVGKKRSDRNIGDYDRAQNPPKPGIEARGGDQRISQARREIDPYSFIDFKKKNRPRAVSRTQGNTRGYQQQQGQLGLPQPLTPYGVGLETIPESYYEAGDQNPTNQAYFSEQQDQFQGTGWSQQHYQYERQQQSYPWPQGKGEYHSNIYQQQNHQGLSQQGQANSLNSNLSQRNPWALSRQNHQPGQDSPGVNFGGAFGGLESSQPTSQPLNPAPGLENPPKPPPASRRSRRHFWRNNLCDDDLNRLILTRRNMIFRYEPESGPRPKSHIVPYKLELLEASHRRSVNLRLNREGGQS